MKVVKRSRRTAVAALVASVVLASCSGAEPERRSGQSASPTPSPSSSSTPATPSPTASSSSAAPQRAAEPPAPKVGACHDLDLEAATEPTSEKPPVSCRGDHTAQTFHVGRLETVVDGHLLAVDSEVAQQQVRTTCTRLFAGFVGGTRQDRALSRLKPVWFSPTLAESDEGASWFRCDVVALAGGDELAPLPAPRRLSGILDRRGALDQVGLCGTAAPGTRGFERVICARDHAWKALATIQIAGERYPGARAVRRAGDQACRDRARRASGGAERFQYGWEWPTREQWGAGQDFGYCWVPD